MKRAFITGITGQDGSYLAELLLEKGYEVHGVMRRASVFNTERIEQIYQDPHQKGRRLFLHYGDLSDASNLNQLLKEIQPTEIYNLGAQSHVRVSFDIPEYTANVDALGTLRLLDAIRENEISTKFYQASSSEMFGNVSEVPQKETTAFNPASPYGAAKVFAHNICKIYRTAYNMFICNGILFNHESPRRGKTFVTRKITTSIAAILAGKQDPSRRGRAEADPSRSRPASTSRKRGERAEAEKIYLGNLEAKRDWGYAPEYVEAMWLMLQQEKPQDFVIATGETHSIREFLEEAFSLVGIKDWKKYVGIDPKYYRPVEVNCLQGDCSKAKEALGWQPKVKFKELVKIMLEADLKAEGLDPQKYLKSGI